MSGVEGVQAEKMKAFAAALAAKFKLTVHLWDERLTTAEAQRVLRQTDMSIKRRAQVVDQLAATLILQSFLQATKNR
jgi:putative Holliday junction resolvase